MKSLALLITAALLAFIGNLLAADVPAETLTPQRAIELLSAWKEVVFLGLGILAAIVTWIIGKVQEIKVQLQAQNRRLDNHGSQIAAVSLAANAPAMAPVDTPAPPAAVDSSTEAWKRRLAAAVSGQGTRAELGEPSTSTSLPPAANMPPAADPAPLVLPVSAILAFFAVIFFSGCSTTTADPATNTRNAKINATASYVAQKTLQVAFSTVLNAAVSQADSTAKSNYLDGLALGLRSQEGNLLTSNDVSNLVAIWTPQKPHWLALGTELASVYAQAAPQTPTEAKVILEAMATGLNDTAAS